MKISICSQMSRKLVVLKNRAKFIGIPDQGSLFNKAESNLLRRGFSTVVFLLFFGCFSRQFFYRTLLIDCFWLNEINFSVSDNGLVLRNYLSSTNKSKNQLIAIVGFVSSVSWNKSDLLITVFVSMTFQSCIQFVSFKGRLRWIMKKRYAFKHKK